MMLCGPVARDGGVIARAYAFCTGTLPRATMALLTAVLGHRTAARIARAADWVVNKPNPLVQIFFVAVVCGAVGVFGVGTWPHVVAAKYVSPVHAFTVPLVLIALAASYVAACKVQPGFVTPRNVKRLLEAYPYDYLTFKPADDCTTCLTPKPARSKHCSWCNGCIARFDHHCIWINGCVGANNIRFFLAWLILLAITCLYGIYLVAAVLLGIVHERRLFSLSVVDAVTGARQPATAVHVFLYLLSSENYTTILGVFLLLVTAVLAFFVGHQFYLVITGVTTNELFKWDEVRWRIGQGQTYTVPQSVIARASHAGARGPAKGASAGGATTVVISNASQLFNLYNRGAVNNLVDVFFPPAGVF